MFMKSFESPHHTSHMFLRDIVRYWNEHRVFNQIKIDGVKYNYTRLNNYINDNRDPNSCVIIPRLIQYVIFTAQNGERYIRELPVTPPVDILIHKSNWNLFTNPENT